MRRKTDYTIRELICDNCGGQMQCRNGVAECPFCGTDYLLPDYEEMVQEEVQGKNKSLFKIKKLRILLLIAAIISGVGGVILTGEYRLSGIIALVQCGLFLVAWLMSRRVNPKKNHMPMILGALGLILTIPCFALFDEIFVLPVSEKPKEFAWTDVRLHEELPEPPKTLGFLHENTREGAYIELVDVSYDEYSDYVEQCMERGYTVDGVDGSFYYRAHNSDGWYLELFSWDHDSKMIISLEEPEEMTELTWPAMGLGALLPEPPSLIGHIIWDTGAGFDVHIGNMSYEQYCAYVALCEEQGFVIDREASQYSFVAQNAEGYGVSLEYLGYNKIAISVYNRRELEALVP